MVVESELGIHVAGGGRAHHESTSDVVPHGTGQHKEHCQTGNPIHKSYNKPFVLNHELALQGQVDCAAGQPGVELAEMEANSRVLMK